MPSFLRHTSFGGIKPAVSPFLLQPPNAQVAHNVRTGDFRLCPLREPAQVDTGLAGCVWTLPTYDLGGQPQLLTDVAETYIVPLYTACSPGLADYGVFRKGVPPVRLNSSGVSSALVPTAPASAMSVTDVTPASVTPPSDYTGPDARAYTYTWVYEHGVESRPAPPVVVSNTFDGAHWQLTLPSPPVGVLGVRIYRMTYGANEIGDKPDMQQLTSFHLVTEIDPATTVLVDTLRQTEMEMGELLTTDACDPPDMEQVFALENGALVGWSDNRVFFSEHGEPWNWPVRYRFELPHSIVGMAVTGNSVFVGTNAVPYRLDVGMPEGDEPRMPIAVHEYTEPAPIDSRHQIASFPWGAIMAARQTLVQLTGNSVMPLMRHLVTDEQWRTGFRPTWLAYASGRIYGAGASIPMLGTTAKAWSLDVTHDGHVRPDTLVTLDLEATWLHEGLDGNLYYVAPDGRVMQWDAGPGVMSYDWVGPKERMRGRTKFAATKVDGDMSTGPVTVTLSADGAIVHSQLAPSPMTWRMPNGLRGTVWEVWLHGKACIDEVHVAQTKYELIQVPLESGRA